MKKTVLPFLVIVSILLSACAPIHPESASATPAPASSEAAVSGAASSGVALPVDPDVREGTLPNGLRYYVRANDEPEHRAELWLAVNAGSTSEEDDQRGLAHFLEHMLFNGTDEYPHTELVNFLESIGMEFGPDVNAYTSFDETVFTIQAPTDTPETLSEGLDVLKEWSAHALIHPDEVDAERGVVREEWRMRDLNASGRISDGIVEALLGGSRYAERLPIGDMEIVGSAPAEKIRSFYEKWYRPDNMAIIAVGDFDPADVEAQIQFAFGDLKDAGPAPEKSTWAVPDLGATQARIFKDPEFPYTMVEMTWRQQPTVATTTEDFRSSLITSLTTQVLNYRFSDLRRAANPPFLDAGASVGSLVRAADQSTIGAYIEEGSIEPALNAIITETERLRRYGVTPAELTRGQTELLRGFEDAAAEGTNTPSSSLANELLDSFLTGSVPVSAADQYTLAQELIPGITADEIQARAQELFPHENRLLLVVAPEKEGVTLPTEDALLAAIQTVEAGDVAAPAEVASTASLMENTPEPAATASQEPVDEVGAQVIKLANGITVWIKPTDFKSDEVLFHLSSPGGLSLVADAESPAARFATYVASQSGVADMAQGDLERALAGKSMYVSPYIDNSSEGFSGGGSPKDLETMLQLVYLYATQPRMDADALTLIQRAVASQLKERELEPQSALEDRLTEIYCPDHSVVCDNVAEMKLVANLTTDDLSAAWHARFDNLEDATAVLVGNVDVEAVKPLLQKYLGNLPASGAAEVAVDRMPAPPQEVITDTLNKGIDPTAYVDMAWKNPLTPTVDSRVTLRAMENALDIRVREVLREDMGAIYGAGVSGSVASNPENEYDLTISFTVAPTRAVEAVNAVHDIIADLRANGPSDDVLSRAKQTLLSNQEENLENNDAWLTWLERYVVDGEGPASDALTISDAIKAVTAEDVQKMAEAMLPEDARVELILYPQDYTP